MEDFPCETSLVCLAFALFFMPIELAVTEGRKVIKWRVHIKKGIMNIK
jgi:hypothetical protein